MPTAASGNRTFTLTLDLCRHAIVLWVSDGSREEVPLNAGSVASLHKRLIEILDAHDLPSRFNGRPSEIADAILFAEDSAPRVYNRALGRTLQGNAGGDDPRLRALPRRFRRQGEPRPFLVGRVDLAVSRFSGRTASPHPGGMPGLPDRIAREAYSHEVASAGFWAGE